MEPAFARGGVWGPPPALERVSGGGSDLLRIGRKRLRPCAKRPLVFLGTLLALGALLGTRTTAHALCNIIPPAERVYPSTLGAVTSPIVAPGDQVTISLAACDGGTGFATSAAANVVTVTFLPAGDPQAVLTIGGVTVEDCAAGSGPCLTLRFTMPATTSATYPDGLAGPAEIRVLNGGATAALIGPLFQPRPDTTCDRQAETVFRNLTVLPPPNVFQTLIDQPATRVLAALDGSGSLLVPFDYRDVLPLGPAEPVAALLSGSTTVDAFSSAPGVPIAVPDSSWVRSFTIDGRPVPPLLRATDVGNEVFGASDGAEGIVRVARSLGGAPPIFDLQYLRTSNGRGPVVIPAGRWEVAPGVAVPLANLRATTRAVAFARDESIEGNLNGPPFSADADVQDDVVQVIDVPTFTSTLTGRAVAPPTSPISGGTIDTSDEVVAFLESERQQAGADLNGDGQPATDELLRVLTAAGDPVTSDAPGAALVASPFPGIDRKPVAIDGDLVWFREPEVGFQAQSGIFTQGRDADVSPDGRLLAITRPTALCGEVTVERRDGATGTAVSGSVAALRAQCGLTNGANGVVFSPTGSRLYAAATTAGRLLAFRMAIAPDQVTIGGAGNETSAVLSGVTRLAVTPVTPDGAPFTQRVSLYAAAPAANTLTAYDVSESPLGGAPTLVLVRTLQNSAGCTPSATRTCVTSFLSPRDAATSPDGSHVYVAVHGSDRVKVLSRVTGSADVVEIQELVDNGSGGTRLDGTIDVAVSPDGRFVYALSELEDAITTFSRNPATGLLTFVGSIQQGPGVGGLDQGRSIEVSPDGLALYATNAFGEIAVFDRNTATGVLAFNRARGGGFVGLATAGLTISPDSEHVYVQYDFQDGGDVYTRESRLRALDVATGTTRPEIDALPAPAKLASVRGGWAAWIRPGVAFGTLFPAVSLYDTTTGTFPSIDSASGFANKLVLSSQILALAAPENLVVGDADGDGNGGEDTLVVASLANPTAPPTIVGADAIEIGATDVCSGGTASGNPCSGAGDCPGGTCRGVAVSLKVRVANFDGVQDLALAVHRQGVPGSVEVGRNVVDFQVSGNLVAFRDRENGLFRVDCSNQNEIPFDNSDADCTDLVMRVYDLVTGETFDTQQATIKCEQPGCEPGLPYKILGDSVAFLTREVDQGGEDLDGDGSSDDTVVQIFNVRRASRQIIKTRNGVFRLPPLPTSFLGAPVVFRDAFEGDLGRDVNGDGDQNDVVVLVDGDADGDGVFDSSDLCVEKPDAGQGDGDGDGLGDACDPTPFCPAVAPPAPPAAPAAANACQDMLGKATQTLFKTWAKARQSCLDRIASGRLDGPAATTCGSVDGDGEPTAPADVPTLAKLFAGLGTLQKSIEQKCTPTLLGQLDACGTTSASLVNCLSDRVGAAAVRTTDLAYGDVSEIGDSKQRSCQKAIAKQAMSYVVSAGNALRRCVDRVNDGKLTGNAAVLCLGAESPLGTTLPADQLTANALVRAAETVGKRLAKPCAGTIPEPLDACGDDAPSIASCARCAGYRQALELIRGAYGP